MTPARKAPPASPARLSYEQVSEAGYDVGLHAQCEPGNVEVGLSVTTGAPLTVGLSLEAPDVGRVLLGLVADGEGMLHLAALTREHGARSWTTPPPAVEGLVARVAALESELAQERAHSAQAQEEAAAVRVGVVSRALDPLSDRAVLLEKELSRVRTELAGALARVERLEREHGEAQGALTQAHASRAEAQAKATEASVSLAERISALEAQAADANLAAQAARQRAESAEQQVQQVTLQAQAAEQQAQARAASTQEELDDVRRDWLQTVDERDALQAQLLIFQEQLTALQNAQRPPAESVPTTPGFQPKAAPWEPERTETGIPELGAPEPVEHRTEEFESLDPTWPGRNKV